MEEFVEWQDSPEVDNKIISLKYRIKFHKTNPVLKQDAVVEYLNELQKCIFVPIDKAASNIPIFLKNNMSEFF